MLILCVLFFGQHFETHTSQQRHLQKVFGHTVTHEARQPLSDIAASSYMQREALKTLPATTNNAGESGFFISEEEMDSSQERMGEIGDALKAVDRDFMHFERLISEEIEQVPRQKVYMKSLIDYSILTLPKRYTSQVEVTVECKKDFQAMLIRPFFYNVLSNFLLNAFKHGLATKMVIQIDGDERKVRIRDNGRGIPADVLPNIFKFQFTTGDKNSRGIGLAFVKLILDASNITVDVVSKQGEGSFTEFVLIFEHDNGK